MTSKVICFIYTSRAFKTVCRQCAEYKDPADSGADDSNTPAHDLIGGIKNGWHYNF